MSTPESLFGDMRALLHDGRPGPDTWSAIMGVLLKIQAPEHALLRAQVAHYLQDQLARDPAWSEVSRQAPIAWTSPHVVDNRPDELLRLFNSFHIQLGYISREALQAHLDALNLCEEIITHIEFDVLAGDADKVLDVLGRMPHVRQLTCHNMDDISFDLESMRQSTAPASLKRLTLNHAKLGQYGFDHLLAIPWLPQITHLNLEWSSLHTSHIAALCELPFDRLESLELEYCNLNAEALATLCVHEGMRHVRTLDVNLNGLHDECGEFLAQAVFADQLECLDVSFNQLSDAGIMQLCTHHFPSLRHLQIDGNNLRSTSIQRLAGATFTPQLERLGLCFSKEIPTQDWLMLCARLAHITHLDLSFCHLTEPVLLALAQHLQDKPLHDLQLAELHPDNNPQALISLLETIPHTELRELSVGDNRLCDAHLLSLKTPFPKLTELHLEHNPVGARGLTHLLSLIAPHRLKMLTLSHTSLQDRSAFPALLDELAAQHISQLELGLEHTSEELILAIIKACAPSLTHLSIKGDTPRSTAFYERLGQMSLPHLTCLACATREGAPHTRFRALARGELCHNPMLHTISWECPDESESPLLYLPLDVHPWLSLRT